MNLLQLIEASDNQYAGWTGRSGGAGRVLVNPAGFPPGNLWEVEVNLNKGSAAPADRSSALMAVRNQYFKGDRPNAFRKLWKTPGIQEKFVAFARNVAPQILAAGELDVSFKKFKYSSKPPTQDEIIRGILLGYKHHGHEQKSSYIRSAKKLGYKIPADVLGALKKSITSSKHTEKRSDLAGAVEEARERVKDAQAKLKAAQDALEAHEAHEDSEP